MVKEPILVIGDSTGQIHSLKLSPNLRKKTKEIIRAMQNNNPREIRSEQTKSTQYSSFCCWSPIIILFFVSGQLKYRNCQKFYLRLFTKFLNKRMVVIWCIILLDILIIVCSCLWARLHLPELILQCDHVG